MSRKRNNDIVSAMEKNNEIIKNKQMNTVGSLLLFITALIWGFAFVAQSKGMESVGPFTFTGIRSVIGAVTLIPWLILNRRTLFKVTDGGTEPNGNDNPSVIINRAKKSKILIIGTLVIGFVFFLASISQQIGILFTDNVGKAGFITALYIVLVPLAGIFLKKKPGWVVYLCVVAATIGLYLLCIPKGSGFSLKKGDLLLILCAFLFTAQIMLIDYYSVRMNGILIAFAQLVVAGFFGLIGMFFWEKPTIREIYDALLPILYAGVLSSGVGYTLQILGQKYVEPTKASLIMCLESVFSVLGGWLILHQKLTLREGIGCIIMFAAIIVCQVFGNAGKKG